MAKYEITIDCAPMTPRPDAYIDGVIKDTGLTNPVCRSKLLGSWVFTCDMPDSLSEEAVDAAVTQRLVALYDSGAIRYADWGKVK